MKGNVRVIVQNKKIRYDFEIRRNITIIQGDSATGKTSLVDMIREYYEDGADSGVELHCEKNCVILEGKKWQAVLPTITDSLIFIDEGNSFVKSQEFASAIQHTDNYYIIVTRERLDNLPYSVDEIYGIRNSGKYGGLKQVYNEFFHLYGRNETGVSIEPENLITEDSNSGYQFWKWVSETQGKKCQTDQGKSNIFKCLSTYGDEQALIVADGAAFGCEIARIHHLMEDHENIHLYLPESFEWLILKSGILKDKEVETILEAPASYIESSQYFSWERFFTDLLIRKTNGTYLQYGKKVLNPAYMQDEIADGILACVEFWTK